ncbi:MAG: hypothetical protein M3375_08555 [Actinomycetota bacterium]|nr:hypothetical protein [Actinomycetota bacterium]
MGFLVILFFFGLSAGVVAKIKGSSFILWFLIGFCLPFFGTLAALLTRNDRQVDVRECDECHNVVAIHDQVCSRCGRDLDYVDPVEDLEPMHDTAHLRSG